VFALGSHLIRKRLSIGQRRPDPVGNQIVFLRERFQGQLAGNHSRNPADRETGAGEIGHAPGCGLTQFNLGKIAPPQTLLNETRPQLRGFVTGSRGKSLHIAFDRLGQPQSHDRGFTHAATIACSWLDSQ